LLQINEVTFLRNRLGFSHAEPGLLIRAPAHALRLLWERRSIASDNEDARANAVLGNTGTLISFRLGPKDASFIGLEFQEKFTSLDLMNLPNYHIYLRLMIDDTPSIPFSALTWRPEN
jgi:hypothetical protein